MVVPPPPPPPCSSGDPHRGQPEALVWPAMGRGAKQALPAPVSQPLPSQEGGEVGL